MAKATTLDSTAQEQANAIVKNYLIDNPIDVIKKGLESECTLDALLEAKELLLAQRKLFNTCIDTLQDDIKNGKFIERPKKKRRSTTTSSRGGGSKRRSSSEAPATTLVTRILEPGMKVAAKIARSHDLWILGSVVKHLASSHSYEIRDDDGEDESSARRHVVHEKKLLALPVEGEEWVRYNVDSRVMAMYPNTSSFYEATVVLPNPVGSSSVLLKFDDDANDFGVIPDRRVPYRFVVKQQ